MTELKAQGIDIKYDKALNGETLEAALKEFQPTILVVRSTKVQQPHLDANPSLELIIRAGAGFDTIDVAYASKKGVFVANCPGKNSTAVAELAMGMILNVDRRLADGVALLREGKWRKATFASCLGLKGRTLGVIGFGNIGRLIADRAKAFEMKIAAADPFLTPEGAKAAGVQYCATNDELLAVSDIITLHVPALPSTKGMVNAEFLGKMKKNGVLLNTSRGDIINEADLIAHLDANPDFYYACDVYQGEPSTGSADDFQHKLAQHPRVYGTHHIGASTKQAEAAIGEESVRIIKKFAATGAVDDGNCVNKSRPPKAEESHSLAIVHESKAGVLAHILATVDKHGILVQEFNNLVL